MVEHLFGSWALVAVATFIVLFLMTGSVILPLKQLVMNVLGLSAVFGILVLIFQDGRFESLLGYTSQGGLELHPAAASVRGRVRALHGLRRVPALADQRGPGFASDPRRLRSGSSAPGGS